MIGFSATSVIKDFKKRFACVSGQKDKIASFVTIKGRQFAVQTKPTTGVYIWFERYNPAISGVEVRNRKNPGMPYFAHQSRSSALNDTNASRLKMGNKAWYLKFSAQESLDEFISWYEVY